MKVLLLNKSYEVHDVITWQDAVTKYVTRKAVKPSGHEDYYDIHTSTTVFKLPTVLVLVTYVRVPHKGVAVNKENVLKRDSYECQYCGKRLTNSTGTIDHVFPQSKGGRHTWSNVVASCQECNCEKNDLTLEEMAEREIESELREIELAEKEKRTPRPVKKAMRLRCRPFIPTRDVLILTTYDLKTHETWTKWIM